MSSTNNFVQAKLSQTVADKLEPGALLRAYCDGPHVSDFIFQRCQELHSEIIDKPEKSKTMNSSNL